MNSITKSIDVNLPVSTVYNQWTQFEEFPMFMDGVEEIIQVDDEMTHWTVNIGGINREFDAQIVEQHPDERIAWKSVDGPEHAGVVTFHRLNDEQTRVTLQMDWEPEGLAEKVGAGLKLDEAQIQNDLNNFKEIIEANGFETGGWRGDIPADSPAGRFAQTVSIV